MNGRDLGSLYRTAWAATAIALLAPALHAASICRWVDENGRTQISDVVPDRYRSVAQCTSSRQHELSPGQQREAEQRAAEETSRARAQGEKPPAPQAPGPSVTAPAPEPKRPAETVTDTTDCPTWWRLYDESSACFGPYRTVRGGIKPEAFEHCNVVPSPEPRCGPRRH